jgi:nicotinamide-nucleotide amidase
MSADPLAASVVTALTGRGETVAVAESLTGGLLAAALTSVPGASAVVRGGVVSYATDLKASLLGVPEELLAARGPVDAEVAGRMAAGVRRRCAATYGVATTGVAGPDPQDGVAVGTVFVAVAGPSGEPAVEPLHLAGDRWQIRDATVAAALRALRVVLALP